MAKENEQTLAERLQREKGIRIAYGPNFDIRRVVFIPAKPSFGDALNEMRPGESGVPDGDFLIIGRFIKRE